MSNLKISRIEVHEFGFDLRVDSLKNVTLAS
jgi:hypothetical protein